MPILPADCRLQCRQLASAARRCRSGLRTVPTRSRGRRSAPCRSSDARPNHCARRSARAAGGSRSRCSSPGSSHHALPQKVEAMVRPSMRTGETVLPFLDPFGDFPRGLGPPLRHGNIGLESVIVVSYLPIGVSWLPRVSSVGGRLVADPASRTATAYHCPFRSARLRPSPRRRSPRPRPGSSARSSRRSVPRPFPGR